MMYDNSEYHRFRPRYNFEDTAHLLPQDTPVPCYVRCYRCLACCCASRRRIGVLFLACAGCYLIVSNIDAIFNHIERQSTRKSYIQSSGYIEQPTYKWIEQARHFQQVPHVYTPLPEDDHASAMSRWYDAHVLLDIECPNLERVVGSASDPTKWWLCHVRHLNRLKHCIIYTSGPPNGLMVETKLQAMLPDCQIHVLDPSGLSTTSTNSNSTIQVHNYGLAAITKEVTTEEGKFVVSKTLPDVMALLGHNHIDLLVLNCAGCEWAIYEQLLAIDLHQLVVQVHGMQHASFFTSMTKAGFVLFYQAPTTWKQVTGRAHVLSFLKLKPEFFELA